MCTEEPIYFDATPEGSVICDWDLPPHGHATSSMPSCNEGFFLAGRAQNESSEEHTNGPGSKKTRPPKLVREVRELQDSVRQLSLEVQSKADAADCAIVHVALDQKATQQDLDAALHQKVSQQDLDAILQHTVSQHDFELLSEGLRSKVENAVLEEALQQKVSQNVFQEALSCKASHEHFEQLRNRVRKKLDSTLDSVQHDPDQKANDIDFQRLCFNVEGKADRTSVQAALAHKVSWDAMTWRMLSCGALWALTVTACLAMIAFLFYLLLRQQQELHQLASLNKELISNFDRLQLQQHWLHDTIEEHQRGLESGLQHDISGKALVHHQVFKSGKLHDDTYTVELVPPFANAWLIVDAYMGTAGTVCSGKADAILRAEHKIFSFYEPPAIQDSSLEGPSAAIVPAEENGGVVASTSTTTTTTSIPDEDCRIAKKTQPCMIMTTSLKEQQGGSIVVLINFKRDPDSLNGFNSSIYDVSGKIQWFSHES
jgi:hypothetical protein